MEHCRALSVKRLFWLLRRVHNHFGSGLARFKLGAHFLDLCGLRLENLHFLLQLIDFAMFFDELIEHHCVDSLPEHGIHLAFAIADDQIEIRAGERRPKSPAALCRWLR
jgi:hypothetical protein